MAVDYKTEKMYTYLKGYYSAMNWQDALSALTFAKMQHEGVTRKDGRPYLVHPLTMACHIAALNIRDEVISASALLHDVVEDCNVTVEQLPVQNQRIKDTVRRLTHVKPTPLAVYYNGIAESPEATMVKIFDRCDNVSSMAGVFTLEKTDSYIHETNEYVMPLYRKAKNYWPQYSNALFVLKYHIVSVTDGLHAITEEINKQNLDSMLSTPFGVIIKNVLDKKNCSMQDLAFALDVPMNTLEKFCRHESKPSKTVINKIAAMADLPKAYITQIFENNEKTGE